MASGARACRRRARARASIRFSPCRWCTGCSRPAANGVCIGIGLIAAHSLICSASIPADEDDKRRHGYSRDHRPDCVQVIIALVVTPQGFPLAHEVLARNTADSTTLKEFFARIEHQYGKARHVWCMDRGVPTEEVLAQMRTADPPVQYLVGTPKGRLKRLEHARLEQPWHQARPEVKVKLLPDEGELYVFAESRDRVVKAMRGNARQFEAIRGNSST
jgi:hypothetical protein